MRLLFAAIFVAMVFITSKAAMREGVFDAIARLSVDPWAVATLWDAYCGFLTYYVWVFYKEGWAGRAVWFVLIMGLGNIAMSAYALLQLFRVPVDASFADVVLRKPREAVR